MRVHGYNPRDWKSHPPYSFKPYGSSIKRGPLKKLVPIQQTLSEITGPLFNDIQLEPGENDLTRDPVTGKEAMGDSAQWIKDGMECSVMLWNGQPLTVTPPAHVELKIVETDPGVRGDTATGGSKPAKLETGAMVRVPLFISEGEVVRVDTRTGEYLARGKG